MLVMMSDLTAADVDEAAVSQLLKSPPTGAALDRLIERQPSELKTIVLTIALEGAAVPDRIARLKPLVDGHREWVSSHPWMACSLAAAQATVSPQQAEQTLTLLPKPSTDLDRADAGSANVAIALAKQNSDVARDLLHHARADLGRAVPEPAYATWRSRLIQHRLEQLARQLPKPAKPDKPAPDGGPACTAWLAADRQRTIEAYIRVASEYPDTCFADAAIIEFVRRCDDPRDLRKGLELLSSQRLEHGSLATTAWLLRCDILICMGKKQTEARAAAEAALALLDQPCTNDIPDAARPLVTPTKPLHRFEGWSYPMWEARPTGVLLTRADPSIVSYLRYQTLVRLAALHWCAGDKATASALARSVVMFDEVDRSMAEDERGPGGLVLSHTCETGRFVVPLDDVFRLGPDVRMLALMGVAFYQVYDWQQASVWLERAMNAIPANHPARDTMTTALANSEQMAGRKDRALALAGLVKLRRASPPSKAWYIARLTESEIYEQTEYHTEPCRSLAVLQTIRDQAPGTKFAINAQLMQATHAMAHDLHLARSLFLAFLKDHPDAYPESANHFLSEIDRRLKEQSTIPSPPNPKTTP
jgi:hypothetical protein